MSEEPQPSDLELKQKEIYSSVEMSKISETEGEETGHEEGPQE